MRFFLQVFGLAVVALSVLLLVNTFSRSAQPRAKGSPASSEGFDDRVIGEHLAQSIRFRTVSHQDPTWRERVALFDGALK